jgi:hypothetical protein
MPVDHQQVRQQLAETTVDRVLDDLLSPLARPSTPDDKYLLVKGISGMGSRILCGLRGILYAGLSGRRLLIDWSDPLYSSYGNNVFHRFFKSVSCSPTDTTPTTEAIYPKIWRGRLHDSARQIANECFYNASEVRRYLSIDVSQLDCQERLVVLTGYTAPTELLTTHFRGRSEELVRFSDPEILRGLLRRDFTLQPDISKRIELFKSRCFDLPTVGIHVRFSDFRSRLLRTIHHLNQLLRQEPRLRIFVATDNFAIFKMFQSNYPDVIGTPHWYGVPGTTIHANRANPDPTEAGIEALVDLHLLAHCDHLIFDPASTFGFVADLLSSAAEPNKIKVGPRGKGNHHLRHATTWLLGVSNFSSWAFHLFSKLVSIRKL